MALLTSAAIQGYRDYTKRRIAYAKYAQPITRCRLNR